MYTLFFVALLPIQPHYIRQIFFKTIVPMAQLFILLNLIAK